MFNKYLRNERGFSMIEMMVVLIIISVLIAGGSRFYLGYIENAKITKAKAQISTMQAALDVYYTENGSYPNGTDLASLQSEILNAGLVVTGTPTGGTAGDDGTLSVTDTWGSNYLYHSTDGTKYYIRSGENAVQNQQTTSVFGNGSAGDSNQPTVGTAAEPT